MTRIVEFMLLAPLLTAGVLIQLRARPKTQQMLLQVATGVSFSLALLLILLQPLLLPWLGQHTTTPHQLINFGTTAFTAFCFLAALLCPISLQFRREAMTMLLIEIGTLVALHTDYLFVFWLGSILAAIPIYSDLRASQHDDEARVFLIFQIAGNIALFAAFFSLYQDLAAFSPTPTFSIQQLAKLTPKASISGLTSGLFGLALVMRLGLFPFHPQLLVVFRKARYSGMIVFLVSHLMLASMIKFGATWTSALLSPIRYVLLSFLVISAVYFSLISLSQYALRQLMGYQLLSFLSLGCTVLFASVPNHAAFGTTEILALCSIYCGLFGIIWIVHTHMGVDDISEYQGLAQRSPRLATLFLLLVLAGAGLPGTVGYIAEEALLQQEFHYSTWQGIVALLTMGCNAWVMFRCFARLFLGPTPIPSAIYIQATKRETLALLCLIAFLFIHGFFPDLAMH